MFTKKYILNIGLAFTLLYAGISALLFPFDWIGFVPVWVENLGFSQELALHMHSVVEIILGVLLLCNIKTRIVAGIIALDIAAIVILGGFGRGMFLVTFRDVGLVCTALYLALSEE